MILSSQEPAPKSGICPQVHASKNGYAKPTKIAAATALVQNFALSAMPPEMMAGMQAAKPRSRKKCTMSIGLVATSVSALCQKFSDLTP